MRIHQTCKTVHYKMAKFTWKVSLGDSLLLYVAIFHPVSDEIRRDEVSGEIRKK